MRVKDTVSWLPEALRSTTGTSEDFLRKLARSKDYLPYSNSQLVWVTTKQHAVNTMISFTNVLLGPSAMAL